MISDARGRHVSPGVYTEEKDVTYSVKSLGITSLGLVGETLYGPAFENIEIEEWSDFVDYFGGTSSEKFRKTGLPKYELPYIAKSYLTKSKRLNVVKVLGLSGYEAGRCWVIKTAKVEPTPEDGWTYNDGVDKNGNTLPTFEAKPLIILRSKMKYNEPKEGGICGPETDTPSELVDSISVGPYKPAFYSSDCVEVGSGKTFDSCRKLCIDVTLKERTEDDQEIHEIYNVSLDPRDSDYIYKVISSSPEYGKSSIYVEEIFEAGLNEVVGTLTRTDATLKNVAKEVYACVDTTSTIEPLTDDLYNDYKSQYRCAQTPWVVSEAYASQNQADSNNNGECGLNITLRKLFKLLTISDGNAANYQVKVSFEKINPFDGTFDVVVRDFNDNDTYPVVLEKFAKCTMTKGDSSFIGYKIGTSDGMYATKSKYITVMLADDMEDYSGSVPCGFLGYPCPTYGTDIVPEISYNTVYNPNIKAKKQYFGLSGIDNDFLSFKGTKLYDDDLGGRSMNNSCEGDETGCCYVLEDTYTKGFHMDSIFSMLGTNGKITIDGDEYTEGFDYVSPLKVTAHDYIPRITSERLPGTNETEKQQRLINGGYMSETIYKDPEVRKFTVCFYGGFDGWDVHRGYRTNLNVFNANVYGTTDTYGQVCNWQYFKLPQYMNNTSDYYAYLAGYQVLSNPQDVEINVFATPGIDWLNNSLLTQDAIHIIEDPDDGRGGDALYIMNSPYYDYKEVTTSPEGYGVYPITDVNELVSLFDDTEINSSYACTYFPWVLFKDTVRNEYLYLPPTKDVVRNIADTDNTLFPWYSPAGISRGSVVCEKAAFKTTLPEEDVLYGNRINPIKTFGKDGVKVWGNKTAYEIDSPLNRINVRRLMIRVKKLVTSAAKHLIFEQYDDALEKQFRGLVEPILAEVKSNRGIFDYRVITEVTPETRDQHILPAKIMIKPTPALEYISISFVVYPESVAFEE